MLTRSNRKQAAGFTIIELMIATAVFAVILLVIGAAITTIGRLYYKGIIKAKTQTVARTITEDISQAIQYSGSTAAVQFQAGTPNAECIGSRRYTYLINSQLSDTPAGSQVRHGLVVDNNAAGGCAPLDLATFNAATMRELLGSKMRLHALSVTPVVGSTNLFTITVTVIYGDDDVLDPTFSFCRGGSGLGYQFCAVSILTTTVQKRL